MNSDPQWWFVEVNNFWYVECHNGLHSARWIRSRWCPSGMSLEAAMQFVVTNCADSKQWYRIINYSTGVILPGDLL
jgi:hypothetical protein